MKTDKILFFILLTLLTAFSRPSYSDSLEVLIEQIKQYAEDPSLMKLDYNLIEFQRSKEKTQKMFYYQTQLHQVRLLAFNTLKLKSYETTVDLNQLKGIPPITPMQALPYFENLQKQKETLKTGDLVLIAPISIYSELFKKNLNIEYSHCGIIWVKQNKPFVVQIHPHADLVIVPLVDFLFPNTPKNSQIAIYRYKDEFDRIEMDYLLKVIEEKKDNIMFDEYLVINQPIKNPEEYFSKDNFFYCTEFPYVCYQYVLGNKEFLSPFRYDTKDLIKYITSNPILTFTIEQFANTVQKQNQFLLASRHFSESEHFKKLALIKNNNKETT